MDLKRALLAAAFFAAAFYLPAASPLERTQANVQFNLALNFYKAGKLEPAAETLRKALKAVPEHPQANLLLGLVLSQQGDFKGAQAPLALASRLDPSNFDAANNLGIVAYQLKDYSAAAAAFARAAALKPERTDVLINLGVLELSQKHWPAAKEAFAKAALAEPQNAKALAGLAEAAGQSGDLPGEIAALQKGLALEPANAGLRKSLAQKLYRAERNDEAYSVVQPLQGQGDSEAEFLLGCLSYRRAQFEDSRLRFEAALQARPDYPEARFNLAITLYDQNKFSEALSQFEEVLKRHPGDEQAKGNLEITRRAAVRASLKSGSQDFLQGDYLAAMEKWRGALALEPGNKVIKDLVETAQAQLTLQAAELAGKGDLAFQAGKVEEAVGAWGSALERDPQNAEAKAGMDKVASQAKKLAEIYAADFRKRMGEGELGKAGDAAKRLAAVDKAAGAAAQKEWAAASSAEASRLGAAGEAALQKGALAEAVEKLGAASKLQPGTGVSQRLDKAKVALRDELARALSAGKESEAAKNSASALASYRRVLELDPSNREAQDASKRLAKAAKAKSADPAELDDWYYQGVYAYAAGKTDEAMGHWNKVLAKNPDHRLAAEALKRAKNRLKALADVK
jgi:tetratricopeptide (TPR) repeat protein